MVMRFTIDGNEWPVILSSINIQKQISGRYSSATFNTKMIDVKDLAVVPGQFSEVVIYNNATGAKIFNGIVTEIDVSQKSGNFQIWAISCTGLEYLLDNALYSGTFTDVSDRTIIQTAFTSVLSEITTLDSTVAELETGLTFTAKDLTLHQLLDQVCALTAADYRITENGELYYYSPGTIVAPFSFSDAPNIVPKI
jgi:hypothetical protein